MKRTIADFLDTEVKEYSISVIKERALPCVIDGLKPVQRKILYTANKSARGFINTGAFGGFVKAVGGYEKGDKSVEDATIKMVQNFAGSNNVPWMEGDGTFGNRFVPHGAAASRYTKVRLSENFYSFYTDSELHAYTPGRDDEFFEPDFYLPIIPTILLNGPKGIAVGYDCEFQPYKATDITGNVLRVVKGKAQKTMVPYFEGYKGKIVPAVGTHEWIMYGVIEKVNSTTFRITEVPTETSLEKYVGVLNKLVDDGYIKDFEDRCGGDKFDFIISVTRENGTLMESMNYDNLMAKFKLRRVLKQRLNTISENNGLLRFQTANEIIAYFTKFRLGVMERRKTYHIEKLANELEWLQYKLSFMRIVIDGDFIFANFKNKKAMEKNLGNWVPKEYIDRLLNIPIYSFNQEELDKVQDMCYDIGKASDFYKKSTPEKLFESDIDALYAQL